MKETIQVKIIEGGKAREVNPLGEKPNTKDTQSHQLDDFFKSKVVEQWQEAESKLRTFEIENCKKDCICEFQKRGIDFNCEVLNSIHQAKILDNGKIEIC